MTEKEIQAEFFKITWLRQEQKRRSYCQMLWIRFFSAQQWRRFAGCLDLFISPASEARFEPVVHLASAGG